MNKAEFLTRLSTGLSGLPGGEIEERVAFYSEMIEDRMEEGLTEEEAVAAVGDAHEIAAQIIDEFPLVRLAGEKIKPGRRLKRREIVLLAVGSPLWLALLIAALAVVLALYVAWWSVIVSLWAVFAAVIGSALGGVAAGIVLICYGSVPSGVTLIAAGLVCAGLAVFLFYGCKWAIKGTLRLTRKALWGIKKKLMNREGA